MKNPFEQLLRRLDKLNGIHELYRKAESELEAHIGRSICMPNCGECCQTSSILVWGIEVEAMASYLLGKKKLLKDVMDRCENWLRTGNRGAHTPSYYQQNLDKLMERARELYSSQCCLLDGAKQCLIYPMRPLACRSYGVTVYPHRCPRPCGLGESGSTRAYNGGMANIINDELTDLLKDCAQESFTATVGFLPTLLMMRLRSRAFVSLVDSGKVDPVKLARNFVHSPAALFQRQFSDLTLSGDKALQEVEATGINTGPVIVRI